MTVHEVYTSLVEQFHRHGIVQAESQASLLLEALIGIEYNQIFFNQKFFPETLSEKMSSWLKRRIAGEPIQYITGQAYFYGVSFKVGPGVLIPRPETEVLWETVRKRAVSSQCVWDVGTGSGILAILLKKEFQNLEIWASDISSKALEYARQNSEILHVPDIHWQESDLDYSIPEDICFDMIMANLPYITSDDMRELPVEVKDFEPHNALDGGKEGLNIVFSLLDKGLYRLNPNGLILLELGKEDQFYKVIDQTKKLKNFKLEEIILDLNNYKRVIVLRKVNNG